MNVILVNFSTTYHRHIAREICRLGASVSAIYYIPGYRDPRTAFRVPEWDPISDYNAPEFKRTELVDLRKLQQISFAEQLVGRFGTHLSKDIIDRMAGCEQMFLRQSDRMSFYPVTTLQRLRLYYALMDYFLYVYERTGADAVVFSDSPHVGFDTVMWFLAQELGIPTFVIERVHINDASMLLSDFSNKPSIPRHYLSNYSLTEIMTMLEECEWPVKPSDVKQFRSLFNIEKKHDSFDRQRRSRIFEWRRWIPLLRFAKRIAFRFVLPYREIYARHLIMGSRSQARDVGRSKLIHARRIRELLTLLDGIADHQPDMSVPFVFFPLHMQPEKTTSTFGGLFEDQLLAIRMLSAAVPGNYEIFVREHPAQLDPNRPENTHYRDKAFYRMLSSIPKVRVIGHSTSFDRLVSESRIVATVTGSAGWKSLVLGRPAIVFGESWYSPCRACFRVGSVEDCKDAIRRGSTMERDEVTRELARFVLYYQRYFVRCATNPRHITEFNASYEKQVNTYASVIVNAICQNQR